MSLVVKVRSSTDLCGSVAVVQLDGGAQDGVRAGGRLVPLRRRRYRSPRREHSVHGAALRAVPSGHRSRRSGARARGCVRGRSVDGREVSAGGGAREGAQYFDPREKFNVLTLGMNPSFLTIIVPIGLLYVLPKLTAGMDPDDVKKAQEEMGSADPSLVLAGMLGGGQPNADDSDDD
ncbi:unnamed protein product [Hyaloperonospora brassicae]|uniref:ER membrane protein complex subunit 7 beta-sandwich domain-containing protein n=1 Tax=Hyaloperonospora brassicae TaxID=162125 RepID=A0AAV0TVZ3_HYABA|nr:unnamed protein product [Hyaloperonospora brassicae]